MEQSAVDVAGGGMIGKTCCPTSSAGYEKGTCHLL